MKNQIEIQNYLGFDDGFYDLPDYLSHFRYVHLAACREEERAMDSKEGGLFSIKLVELLKTGGINRSYRDLMQSLYYDVSLSDIHRQHPVAISAEEKDLERPFLGSGFIPYVPLYELRYIDGLKAWQLQAGSLMGIPASSSGKLSRIRITGQDSDVEANIVSVSSHTSQLEGMDLYKLDKKCNRYRAYLIYLAIPRLLFDFIDEDQNPAEKQKLIKSFDASSHLYIAPKVKKKTKQTFLCKLYTREKNLSLPFRNILF